MKSDLKSYKIKPVLTVVFGKHLQEMIWKKNSQEISQKHSNNKVILPRKKN